MLGGRVGFVQAAREGFRRGRAAFGSRRERELIEKLINRPAQLTPEFQNLSPAQLLQHFRQRDKPTFFSGFEASDDTARFHSELLSQQSEHLIADAKAIASGHRWSLLGFGERDFGRPINWHRDPLSGRVWPLDYHAEIPLWHHDGSDIRVLWELNRLGHLIILGLAYALTKEELLAEEFFSQIESWDEQNPIGRGANWACAMEVALRAMNLLAAFTLFKTSPALTAKRLTLILKLFDQHGSHIERNLEFSYISTSNHYLSDLAGLLWLGIELPELRSAKAWRDRALAEMHREIGKQVLRDGADYEGSTGYHCFVLELFLYSSLLCEFNDVAISHEFRNSLQSMFVYLRAILRPDGLIPLVGDVDGSRLLPIVRRSGNDRAHLLALAAVNFADPQFKLPELELTPELIWSTGEYGVARYTQLSPSGKHRTSEAFPDAGIYVMRQDDQYLLFNASSSQYGRPASHRHNDIFSFEVAAGGRAFIVDPGSYVYTADLQERHRFRSTAYHSTIQIDDEEQRTIRESEPFKIGAEARIRVLSWESNAQRDRIVAEHDGYARLAQPVTHRRAVTFDKTNRWWLIEDELTGRGNHLVATRFHFDAELDVSRVAERGVAAKDSSAVQLLVFALSSDESPGLNFEPQFVSRDYGSKLPSTTACWSVQADVPLKLRWAIVPACAGEVAQERLSLVQNLVSVFS